MKSANKNGALPRTSVEAGEIAPRWFAGFVDGEAPRVRGYDLLAVAQDRNRRRLFLGSEIGGNLPSVASDENCSLIFYGALYDASDLVGETVFGPSSEAEIVLAGYSKWGEDVFRRLRGTFALTLWDRARDTIFCLRDPLGTYPLFYTSVGKSLTCSTSIEILLQQPRVSRSINRGALADFFIDRHPRPEETFFADVNRVPPGHVLRVSSTDRHMYRYWDPAPDGEVRWLTADEVERFDEFLDRAVARCLSFGKTGIFLSGGLDSVSVAATALTQTRLQKQANPLCLSLVFPQPDLSEEVVQRSVANQLGLPHVCRQFYDAVGQEQLIGPALELSKTLSTPLMNTWSPAYYGLGLEATRQGCRTILTGNGGDEWLTISPYLSADLMRKFDFRGIYRLGQNLRRSHRRTRFELFRSLLWRFGAQPILLPPLHRFVKGIAPSSISLRRRMFPDIPNWLAPDPELRRELKQRREEYAARKAKNMGDSLYLQEARRALDHPLISWEMEEYFEVYRRAGMRLLHPFWDADLVDLLFRIPPFMLDKDGRNKGLVRTSLNRRFPNLGFERQVKLEATGFYASSVFKEAPPIWQNLTGPNTLADLGVVDAPPVNAMIERLLQRPGNGLHAHRVFNMLNLEAWARAHRA